MAAVLWKLSLALLYCPSATIKLIKWPVPHSLSYNGRSLLPALPGEQEIKHFPPCFGLCVSSWRLFRRSSQFVSSCTASFAVLLHNLRFVVLSHSFPGTVCTPGHMHSDKRTHMNMNYHGNPLSSKLTDTCTHIYQYMFSN